MLGSILSILFPIVEWIFKRLAKTEQDKKDYLSFLEIMARKGVQRASNRLAAQEQINAVKDIWKKEDTKPSA